MIGEYGETASETPKLIFDESEFDEYVNRPDGSPGLKSDSLFTYYREVADLPGMFSRDIPVSDLEVYAGTATARWQSLFDAIADKYKTNIIPESANSFDWVVERLERYAASSEGSAIHAAMLLKYLEGTMPSALVRVLGPKLGDNDRDIQAIRRYFVSSLGQTDEELAYKSGKRSNKNLGVITVKASVQTPERAVEVAQDTKARRIHLANQLASSLGGNKGVYQKMLNLIADFIVSDDDLKSAQNGLFEIVKNMVRPSVSAKLPESLRIDIGLEARWLLLLCGKELVEENGKWYTRPTSKPPTLEGVRNVAHFQRLVQKTGPSPAAAEAAVMSALGKVVEYQNQNKDT